MEPPLPPELLAQLAQAGLTPEQIQKVAQGITPLVEQQRLQLQLEFGEHARQPQAQNQQMAEQIQSAQQQQPAAGVEALTQALLQALQRGPDTSGLRWPRLSPPPAWDKSQHDSMMGYEVPQGIWERHQGCFDNPARDFRAELRGLRPAAAAKGQQGGLSGRPHQGGHFGGPQGRGQYQGGRPPQQGAVPGGWKPRKN